MGTGGRGGCRSPANQTEVGAAQWHPLRGGSGTRRFQRRRITNPILSGIWKQPARSDYECRSEGRDVRGGEKEVGEGEEVVFCLRISMNEDFRPELRRCGNCRQAVRSSDRRIGQRDCFCRFLNGGVSDGNRAILWRLSSEFSPRLKSQAEKSAVTAGVGILQFSSVDSTITSSST